VFDDDVMRLRDNELCSAITFKTAEKHLHDGHIHFSFLIKKNCKETLNIKTPTSPLEQKNFIVAKPASHHMPNKGSIKTNNVRKAQSIPDIKPAVVVIKVDNEISPNKQSPHPPDYSSINKHDANPEKHFKSPAHSTPAINKNDDDLVSKFLLVKVTEIWS
jgi:hypothetical protein